VPSLEIIVFGAKSQLLGGYLGLTHVQIIYGSEHCIALSLYDANWKNSDMLHKLLFC